MLRILVLAFAACTGAATLTALPKFVLSDGTSGGRLSWLSDSTGSQAPTKSEISLGTPSERFVSLELCWSEKPDPRSNEGFLASGVWRVPENILTAPSYTISAEKITEDEIVFVLSTKGSATILHSPSYRVERVVFCTPAEIKKMFGKARTVQPHRPPAHR